MYIWSSSHSHGTCFQAQHLPWGSRVLASSPSMTSTAESSCCRVPPSQLPTPVSCLLSTRLPKGACLRPSHEGTSVPADCPLIQYPRDRGGAGVHLCMLHRATVTLHISEGLPESLSEADTSVLFFVSCLQTAKKKKKSEQKPFFHRNSHQLHFHRAKPLHPKSQIQTPLTEMRRHQQTPALFTAFQGVVTSLLLQKLTGAPFGVGKGLISCLKQSGYQSLRP